MGVKKESISTFKMLFDGNEYQDNLAILILCYVLSFTYFKITHKYLPKFYHKWGNLLGLKNLQKEWDSKLRSTEEDKNIHNHNRIKE